jgi:hypothetical protein
MSGTPAQQPAPPAAGAKGGSMSEPGIAAGSPARPADADRLAQVTEARAVWLDTTTAILAGHPWVVGVWLVGSLGRGQADAYSDVDLVAAVSDTAPAEVFADPVAGLKIPGTVLYRRPKPCNAPAGGAYLAVGVALADLPVLVDVFVWPARTAAVPADALVLYERFGLPAVATGFIPLLDAHRTSDTRGSDPKAAGTVLMLVQLAAKYLVRGNLAKVAGICQQLGIPADGCDIEVLRSVLDHRIDTTLHPHARDAVRAAGRLLDIVDRHVSAPIQDGEPAGSAMPAAGGVHHAQQETDR